MTVGALDESGQERQGTASADAKRQLPDLRAVVAKHCMPKHAWTNYCFIPEDQPATLSRLITVAGDPAPHRAGHGRPGHLRGKRRSRPTSHRHSSPTIHQARPTAAAKPGIIPLTVAEIKNLLKSATSRITPLEHIARWPAWRRRHQARARPGTAYIRLS
ncbi:hypothetical protein OHA25_07310 [Nonomuraea sp. NBC_00507]|uniref:hypothetical protein n=1 Tax=Nonomuraea sp. NBC_00507 TaxID=2976002 RepID=UPI002E16FCE4